MKNKIFALAEESIKIEQNVSEIYFLFHILFPDDSDFWLKLVLEEESHATLIKNGIDMFEPINAFPHGILANNLRMLKETNKKLNSILKQFKDTHPSRELAFNTALDIELSAGELHFQNFQNKVHPSSFENIFQQLNGDDKDHAKRIRSYMRNNDILFLTENKAK